mmetsp:Transcript_13036/g.32838  ORF Transcript_13036/g.32838 Transcript_13036/m.32838 type:complete len:264 (+) Transcript_13036:95-886(+)
MVEAAWLLLRGGSASLRGSGRSGRGAWVHAVVGDLLQAQDAAVVRHHLGGQDLLDVGPLAWVLGQQRVDHLCQLGRVLGGDGRKAAARHLQLQLLHRARLKRHLVRAQLVQHAAQRPDVRGKRKRLPLPKLWRHVLWRRDGRLALAGAQQLHHAGLVEQQVLVGRGVHVGGLDVAVQDAVVVVRAQAVAGLDEVLPDERLLHQLPRARALLHQAREVAAGHVAHDDANGGVVHKHVVDRRAAGVLHRRQLVDLVRGCVLLLVA